jgi:AsmA-like C-terminal region
MSMRAEQKTSQTRWKSKQGIALLVTIGVLVVLAFTIAHLAARLSPLTRTWVIKALRERYQSDVQLKNLTVTLWPHPRVRGEGLVLQPKDRPGFPPLAIVKRFSVETNLLGLLNYPRHFRNLKLEGLVLNIPPRREEQARNSQEQKRRRRLPPFEIEDVNADGTVLNLLPKEAGKRMHTFDILNLRMGSAGIGQPMSFRATLTNPTPPGLIVSTGSFGPWEALEPGQTPVSGKYSFDKADLSVFRGIAGILSSTGQYKGRLQYIEVNGETNTPDFSVRVSGNKVHLQTRFTAVVNGTNGNTLLQPVEAHVGSSTIICYGGVLRTTSTQGRTVALDVTSENSHLEDLLPLAVKGHESPLMGIISLKTKFDLPPGKADIADRLKLDGEFDIRSAHFTDPAIQRKILGLSRRGRGQPEGDGIQRVATNMKGHFVLRDNVMTLSGFSFDVPGALVHLEGTYGLRSEQLHFHGVLELEAKLSQTTTGAKSILLKAVDPLFEKHGKGAYIPIEISGNKDHPEFKLDVRKVF